MRATVATRAAAADDRGARRPRVRRRARPSVGVEAVEVGHAGAAQDAGQLGRSRPRGRREVGCDASAAARTSRATSACARRPVGQRREHGRVVGGRDVAEVVGPARSSSTASIAGDRHCRRERPQPLAARVDRRDDPRRPASATSREQLPTDRLDLGVPDAASGAGHLRSRLDLVERRERGVEARRRRPRPRPGRASVATPLGDARPARRAAPTLTRAAARSASIDAGAVVVRTGGPRRGRPGDRERLAACRGAPRAPPSSSAVAAATAASERRQRVVGRIAVEPAGRRRHAPHSSIAVVAASRSLTGRGETVLGLVRGPRRGVRAARRDATSASAARRSVRRPSASSGRRGGSKPDGSRRPHTGQSSPAAAAGRDGRDRAGDERLALGLHGVRQPPLDPRPASASAATSAPAVAADRRPAAAATASCAAVDAARAAASARHASAASRRRLLGGGQPRGRRRRPAAAPPHRPRRAPRRPRSPAAPRAWRGELVLERRDGRSRSLSTDLAQHEERLAGGGHPVAAREAVPHRLDAGQRRGERPRRRRRPRPAARQRAACSSTARSWAARSSAAGSPGATGTAASAVVTRASSACRCTGTTVQQHRGRRGPPSARRPGRRPRRVRGRRGELAGGVGRAGGCAASAPRWPARSTCRGRARPRHASRRCRRGRGSTRGSRCAASRSPAAAGRTGPAAARRPA